MIEKLKSIKNNQVFLKYFNNTSWLLFEKILRMIVGLLISVWVARYLGPSQFGLFSYAQSFVGLFAVIATLGIDGIVVRELVKDDTKRDILLGTAFVLKLFGAVLVLGILNIAVEFTSNDGTTNILIFIIASATIFQSFNVIDIHFQSKVLSRYAVYANVVGLFITSIIKIILIVNNAPLIAFVWIILFDSMILSLGYIYFYLKNGLTFKMWKFNFSLAKELLKDSWPLIIAGFAIMIYKKIDQVMIQNILQDSTEVGYYAAAAQISLAFVFLPGLVIKSIFPYLMHNRKKIKKLFLIINFMLFYSSLVLFILMLFSSSTIINILYGNEYGSASVILSVHFMINIFIFTGVLVDQLLIIDNKQLNMTYRVTLGACLNIILNYLFIPNYGALGASYATVISQFSTSFLFLILFKDSRIYFMWQIKSMYYPVLIILKRIR